MDWTALDWTERCTIICIETCQMPLSFDNVFSEAISPDPFPTVRLDALEGGLADLGRHIPEQRWLMQDSCICNP